MEYIPQEGDIQLAGELADFMQQRQVEIEQNNNNNLTTTLTTTTIPTTTSLNLLTSLTLTTTPPMEYTHPKWASTGSPLHY